MDTKRSLRTPIKAIKNKCSFEHTKKTIKLKSKLFKPIMYGRAYLKEPFSVKTTFVLCFIQLGLEIEKEKEPAGPR